jgi:DNA-binding NtrC family response regulator
VNKPVEHYHDAVRIFKREFLLQTLAAHNGNRTRTARTLGLERTYLLKMIRDLQLKKEADGKRVGNVPLVPKSS